MGTCLSCSSVSNSSNVRCPEDKDIKVLCYSPGISDGLIISQKVVRAEDSDNTTLEEEQQHEIADLVGELASNMNLIINYRNTPAYRKKQKKHADAHLIMMKYDEQRRSTIKAYNEQQSSKEMVPGLKCILK